MKTIATVLLAIAFVLAGCTMQTPEKAEKFVLPVDPTAQAMENIVIVGYGSGYRDDAVALVESVDPGAEIRADLRGISAVSFRTTKRLEEIRASVEASFEADKELKDKIAYIEPSYRRELVKPVKSDRLFGADISSKANLSYQDDEAYWNYLWGIRNIKAPEAWNAGVTGAGITVAVVDTGVDGTHPDLQGQLVEGYYPLLDQVIPAGADSSVGGAHGTHVSGTIAAKNDGQGVVGVAYDAKIMPIIIFDENGYIGDDYVANGILWAAEHGAKILNNSWGGKGYSSILAEVISYVMKEYGCVFVASAGNSHTDEIHYPSCLPGVINVAASDAQDGITHFSTRGQCVTVAAPGDFTILSSVPLWDAAEFWNRNTPYALYGGTSMATPHVTGAIALLLQKLGSTPYEPYQIRKIVEACADDIMATGFDRDSGWGRVNVAKMMEASPGSKGATASFIFTQPYVYFTLYPESPSLPILYGKTFNNGRMDLSQIEPGTYKLYAAFGDAWYAGVNPDDQIAVEATVEFTEGDNTLLYGI